MSTRHPQSRNALWVFLFGKTPGRGNLSGQERRWSYWNRHLLLCRRGKDTKVQRYCRKIYELGYVPICPQYSFSPFLDDGDAEDMQAMRRMSHQILRRCRMVVVCGKETTGTMNTEISMADRLHIICTTLDGLSKIKENE